MNTVIHSIIAMEHKAQEIVDGAKEEKKQLVGRTEKQCVQLEAEIIKRQQTRLHKVAENEKGLMEEKMADITRENERKLAALEEKFAENREGWVAAIVQNIIGGESN